jgi:hypothetical protein
MPSICLPDSFLACLYHHLYPGWLTFTALNKNFWVSDFLSCPTQEKPREREVFSHLTQWFSHFLLDQNDKNQSLLTYDCLGQIWFSSMGLRLYISNKFPGDVDAADEDHTLRTTAPAEMGYICPSTQSPCSCRVWPTLQDYSVSF